MLTELVESTLLAHLRDKLEGLDSLYGFHAPGEVFRPETAPRSSWIEPRIVGWEREGNTTPGEEFERVELQVRCFVVVAHKGEEQLSLSALVDRVRQVIDSTLWGPIADGGSPNAPAIEIKDQSGAVLGFLNFSPVQEQRSYDTSATIEGATVSGLDLAILGSSMLLTGDP